MLKYTLTAWNMIMKEFKRWAKCFEIASLLFMMVYFIYSFAASSGILYVNISLLFAYAVYTIYKLTAREQTDKKQKKQAKRIYKWVRITLKGFTLASTLYGVYTATVSVDGISTIIAVMSLVSWVFSLFLEIVVLVLEPRVKLLVAGLLNDFKPVVGVYDFFSKGNSLGALVELEEQTAILKAQIDSDIADRNLKPTLKN